MLHKEHLLLGVLFLALGTEYLIENSQMSVLVTAGLNRFVINKVENK